ncbi:MAG: hypothetical protein GY694_13350 [Gammaproteobacteria bacterium]|nr:hypothetical protein [Gammaproteobacteria bacterium]
MLQLVPDAKDWIIGLLFAGGVASFLFAMYWDSSDQSRTTRNSDVAFWLHILAAPLLVHPIYSNFGLLNAKASIFDIGIVLSIFTVITIISLIIDR